MRLDQWLAEFTDITLGHHGHGDDTGTISGFAGALPVADRGLSGCCSYPYGLMVVLSLTGLLVSAIANILWHKQKLSI